MYLIQDTSCPYLSLTLVLYKHFSQAIFSAPNTAYLVSSGHLMPKLTDVWFLVLFRHFFVFMYTFETGSPETQAEVAVVLPLLSKSFQEWQEILRVSHYDGFDFIFSDCL